MAKPEAESKEHHRLWRLIDVGLIIGALAVGSNLLAHYLRAGLGPKK